MFLPCLKYTAAVLTLLISFSLWSEIHADSKDVCNLESDTGPCRADMKRYYYDRETRSCKQFIYGGCQGNGNNFETIDACMKLCGVYESSSPGPKDICTLKYDKGRCEALSYSYYYDPQTKSCKQFEYGGCGGNANNFPTFETCMKNCKGV